MCLCKISPLLAAVYSNRLLDQVGHQFNQYISSYIACFQSHGTTLLSSSNPKDSCLLAARCEQWKTTAAIPSGKLEVREEAEHPFMTDITDYPGVSSVSVMKVESLWPSAGQSCAGHCRKVIWWQHHLLPGLRTDLSRGSRCFSPDISPSLAFDRGRIPTVGLQWGIIALSGCSMMLLILLDTLPLQLFNPPFADPQGHHHYS